MNKVESLKDYIDSIKNYWNEIFRLSLLPFNFGKTEKLKEIKNLLVFSVEKNIEYTEMFPGLQLTLIKIIEKYRDDLSNRYLKYLDVLMTLHNEAKKDFKDGKFYRKVMFKGICQDKLDYKIEEEIFNSAGKIFSYNFEHPPFHLF
jgi:hypothetical protein